MKFHSTYVGLDGENYFLVLYTQDHEGGPVRPLNVADNLTEAEASALAAALEEVGDRLWVFDRVVSYTVVGSESGRPFVEHVTADTPAAAVAAATGMTGASERVPVVAVFEGRLPNLAP
jgi:hypothetical protein